ncbi:MAG: glycosyltransferase family 2 protein [Nitrosarchaeum sp.]|nr:glycosyltransferase family 2 protein [Nitrosarchaeum sp.]
MPKLGAVDKNIFYGMDDRKMSQPLVSVIIINYNGRDLLKNCFESLSKIMYPNVEIILIDNNSSDGSVAFTKENFPKIIVHKLDDNKGFAEPNNIGASLATGKYLLFLNNDTTVTENFITELVDVIENDETIGICQSLLLKPDGSIDSSGDFIDDLGVVYNSKTQVDTIREISSARGASMLIRKTLFDELGGFDEKFFVSFEDVDLGWRAWILGYRTVIVPKSIVYHLGGSTIKKINLNIAFHGFKNQLAMKITNFEPSLAIKNTIVFFVIYGLREIRILLDYAISGTTKMSSTKYEKNIACKPSIKVIVKSLAWIMSNPKYLYQKQRIVNQNRVNSTRDLKKMNILSNMAR